MTAVEWQCNLAHITIGGFSVTLDHGQAATLARDLLNGNNPACTGYPLRSHGDVTSILEVTQVAGGNTVVKFGRISDFSYPAGPDLDEEPTPAGSATLNPAERDTLIAQLTDGGQVTAPIHEVIWGPAGPTRNRAVANRIVDDLIHLTHECWLIDVNGAHRDSTIRTARTMAEARTMLAGLNTFRPNDKGQGLCITIEDASVALQDRQIRNSLEEALRGISTASIMFRLVVVSLDLSSFGGSKVIRDEVIAGNVIEAVAL